MNMFDLEMAVRTGNYPEPETAQEGLSLAAATARLANECIKKQTDVIERLTAESERRKAALEACVEFWSDTDIPCPIALHDKVTDAIGAFQQDPKP